MNIQNTVYEDQSFVKKKINALFTLLYHISAKARVHVTLSCLLIFIQDIQLIYYMVFDESLVTLNPSIRSLLKSMGFRDVDYSTFYYIQLSLSIVFLVGVAFILLYVFAISPETYRENYIIKLLRVIVILFNTAAFPIFSHGLANALIPKDGHLAGYPTIEYIKHDIIFFLVSVVTFIFYFFIQLFALIFTFVNPTPFNKKNALCQTYSFLGFKYNFAIFIISFCSVFMRAYSKTIYHYIYVFLSLFMIYMLYDLLKHQPYYNKYVNIFRAGMWSIIPGMGVINLLAFLIGKGKLFFGIMLLVVGFISFFIGAFLSMYFYKKHIEEIFKRFRTKKTEDRMRYYRDKGIEHDNGSSKSSEENDEKLISVDSYSESNNENDKRKNNEESESDDDDDANSDNSGVAISDRISERITSFGSLREIVNEEVLNEPTKVFKELYEFELSCRFIWNNESREAFQLMKELYEEGVAQFSKNAYLCTFYSYYLMYIDKRLSKDDKDKVLGLNIKDDYDDEDDEMSEIREEEEKSEEDEKSEIEEKSDEEKSEQDGRSEEIEEEEEEGEEGGEEELDEEALNGNNPDFLLAKALSLKMNMLLKYLSKYLMIDIKEKKKEDKDFYKKEALERLVKLQHSAVEKHITLLNLLKQFFNNVKLINRNSRNRNENFDMEKFLQSSFILKKETLKLYQEAITQYPDEKSTYQLYTLFMNDIVNQTEQDSFMLNEGDSFMALNEPKQEEDNNNKKSRGGLKKSAKNNGSMASFGVSNDGGDSELKRRKLLKNNMIHTFTDKCKRYTKIIVFIFVLIIVVYVGSVIFGFIHINSYKQSIKDIQTLSDMKYNILNMLSRFRIASGVMAMGSVDFLTIVLPLLEGYIQILEEEYIPILKKYVSIPSSKNPIVQFNPDSTEGNVKSKFINLNGYEFIRSLVVWGKSLFQTPTEVWIEKAAAGENIFLDYRFRMFAENFKYYYDRLIEETTDILYEDEISERNKERLIILILTGVLVVLSLGINFIGLTPLYSNSKRLQNKTMGIFKYLLKGSINDIVSKFEIGIESITETYDISVDNHKKNKYSLENQSVIGRNYNKFVGFIINILIIVSVLLLTIPILSNGSSVVNRVNYNIAAGKRKDIVIYLSMFSYEVLIRDRDCYPPGTAEAYLNNEIEKLEKLQEDIYYGRLGLAPTKDLRYLDEILLEQKCRLDDGSCDTYQERPELSLTKNMLKSGLNEIVDELIEKTKAILKTSNIEKYKNIETMYGPPENMILKVIDAYANGPFAFEIDSITHIFYGLEQFDDILYNNVYESINGTLLYLTFITIAGVISIVTASIVTYKTVIKTNEILNELVNVIFIIPQSTINMIPQFKRFIETGSFEED